jgi:hypothetical protein
VSDEQITLLEEPEEPAAVRALDTVEAECAVCRTCGGQASLRDYRSGKPRDFCDAHLPLTYGQLPAGY